MSAVEIERLIRTNAFCNVVGFRPSIGRVPKPKTAFAWSTLSTSGCLGRSVVDLFLVLSTIAGPDPRAPLSINESGQIFAHPLDRNFGIRRSREQASPRHLSAHGVFRSKPAGSVPCP